MFRIALLSICLLGVARIPLFGQGQGITLAGSGYSDPTVIKVAPGQITTFFVTGLKTILPSGSVSATSIPLPASLAGISVTFNQPGPKSYTAALLALKQLPACVGGGSSATSPPSPTPDCLITAITVQVPFELPYLDPNGGLIDTALVVSENGNASAGFGVFPKMDNIHILNTCDAFPPVSSKAASCQPVVTHGGGTLGDGGRSGQGGRGDCHLCFRTGEGRVGVFGGRVPFVRSSNQRRAKESAVSARSRSHSHLQLCGSRSGLRRTLPDQYNDPRRPRDTICVR